MTTILVTGFGPFPGAPFNPTEALVAHLQRLRRPALADVTIVSHVFPTTYAAVDRELPGLIARHKPDVLLMFGLAARSRTLRIETRARNALALLPHATGGALRRAVIATGGKTTLRLPVPAGRLLAALRAERLPVTLSHDAGKYLCNYLIWRAVETAATESGPRLVAFVHLPAIPRVARRRNARPRVSAGDLARAGTQVLMTLASGPVLTFASRFGRFLCEC
jgi:pyroglutamyl-peptidase